MISDSQKYQWAYAQYIINFQDGTIYVMNLERQQWR